jgi:hypothetical protein
MACSFLRKVEADQALGCGESGDNTYARVAESRDDQQEPTLIGVSDARKPLFAIDGFGFDIERIVVNNLFSLLGRDLMVGHVIAIGIVPLKSEIGTQALL